MNLVQCLCGRVGPDTVPCTLLWPVTWCCRLRICVHACSAPAAHSQVNWQCSVVPTGWGGCCLRTDGGGCRAAAPGCRGHRPALQSLSMLERSGHGTAAACGRGLWCSAVPPWQCELLGSALPALEAPQDVAQHSKTGASLQGRSRRPVLHMPDSRRRHCHGRRARQRGPGCCMGAANLGASYIATTVMSC